MAYDVLLRKGEIKVNIEDDTLFDVHWDAVKKADGSPVSDDYQVPIVSATSDGDYLVGMNESWTL